MDESVRPYIELYGYEPSATFLRDVADALPEDWNLTIPLLRHYADRLEAYDEATS